ncbi:hypothetical protein EZS27_004665 [termite gut metagenome]|uniref:Bro-N domain-containing protein n=1 Tax=termite gut metagenome TaxID=433724 RepID=A0A5J4SRZ5_9ZZZZ
MKIFDSPLFGQLRTLTIKDEKTNEITDWFCLPDLCKILDIQNVSQVKERLDKDVYQIYPLQTNGGIQETTFVNEEGLYEVIIRSDKPISKSFRKWITSEVLPDIRKHGMYLTEDILAKTLEDPIYMIGVLQNYYKERTKRIEAENTIDLLVHINKTYTAGELAKELGFKSAQALNNRLVELHIQYKLNGTWELYSQYASLGWTSIKEEKLPNGCIVYNRHFTGVGREALLKIFNHNK